MPRNEFEFDGWALSKLPAGHSIEPFDCCDKDLNEYFHVDRLSHLANLLTQTYFMTEKSCPELIIGLADFCNDSVRNDKFKVSVPEIPAELFYSTLPAVKITRIGIHKSFQGKSLGSCLMNMIKLFFVSDNRTGCRFITVDAYNRPEVVRYYMKNDFQFFSEKDVNKETRAMFFDLKRIPPPSPV